MGNHYVIFGIPIPNQLNREIKGCPFCEESAATSMLFPFCRFHTKAVEDEYPAFLKVRLPWNRVS